MTTTERYKWGWDCGVRDAKAGTRMGRTPFHRPLSKPEMYDAYLAGYRSIEPSAVPDCEPSTCED